MSVHAYHPATGASAVVEESQLAHMRASGWLTREEHEENQATVTEAADAPAQAKADAKPADPRGN